MLSSFLNSEKRELMILRHGKSDWQINADDFHRPLKTRGKRAAQRMGALLAKLIHIPDYILSSPAKRAFTTAEKCAKSMGLNTEDVHLDPRLYDASVSDLMAALAEIPDDVHRVLLIGHNPGLELLMCHLTNNRVPEPDDGKLLPTATLARIEVNRSWKMLSSGCGRLLTITRPAELPKKFPFPFPDGAELRDRPAYYYNQSAVVPWRVQKGNLEILVVGSSQNNHWVVPKGVGEPGMTLQASAVKEAWEEAGVKGQVDENLLGSYRYQKWGAYSTVAVYAMKVTEQVDDGQWEENHRGRRWLTPKKAKTEVKQLALIPMIDEIDRRFEAGELDG